MRCLKLCILCDVQSISSYKWHVYTGYMHLQHADVTATKSKQHNHIQTIQLDNVEKRTFTALLSKIMTLILYAANHNKHIYVQSFHHRTETYLLAKRLMNYIKHYNQSQRHREILHFTTGFPFIGRIRVLKTVRTTTHSRNWRNK